MVDVLLGVALFLIVAFFIYVLERSGLLFNNKRLRRDRKRLTRNRRIRFERDRDYYIREAEKAAYEMLQEAVRYRAESDDDWD